MSSSNSRQNHQNHPSAYAGRPNQEQDLTWLDFLRSAGGTVRDDRPAPPDRRDSADRKRRHTGSVGESERRNYPYPTFPGRPSDIHGFPPRTSSSGTQAGNSRAPIDLTSPPSRPRHPSYSRMQGSNGNIPSAGGVPHGRRESEIVLPRWQPDSEVTKCPVCETDFSLLYRRHHCRKCGRVVCARCSPHRITIPRQYIVQPPNPFHEYDEPSPNSPTTTTRLNPALGGGEVVRVCNPCVPDPWTPDAAATSPALQPTTNAPGNRMSPPQNPNQSPPGTLDPTMLRAYHADRYRTAMPMPLGGRNRARTHQSAITNPRRVQDFDQLIASASNADRYMRNNLAAMPPDFRGHRHTQSTDPRYRMAPSHSTLHPGSAPTHGSSSHPPPPPPAPSRPPRREIAEDDECWICGADMSSFNSTQRETHVQSCVANASALYSKRPAATTTNSSGSISGSHASAGTPPVPPGLRARTTSNVRARGMHKSVATEKDCIDKDGEPRECPICMEDFEAGDELGRMDQCLCCFHRNCLRGWWERKGHPSCPTHELHEDN